MNISIKLSVIFCSAVQSGSRPQWRTLTQARDIVLSFPRTRTLLPETCICFQCAHNTHTHTPLSTYIRATQQNREVSGLVDTTYFLSIVKTHWPQLLFPQHTPPSNTHRHTNTTHLSTPPPVVCMLCLAACWHLLSAPSEYETSTLCIIHEALLPTCGSVFDLCWLSLIPSCVPSSQSFFLCSLGIRLGWKRGSWLSANSSVSRCSMSGG